MPASKTRLPAAAQAARCSKFRIAKTSRRSQFCPKRREEVKVMRRKRACLRCGLLRIACSHDDICVPCSHLAQALHAHGKQTLSFSGCIRTMPSEASIWESFLPSVESQEALIAMSQKLATRTISLEFSASVNWDLGLLVDDFVDWLANPTLSETSKVGILSSPQFLDLVRSSFEGDVATNFHCMIYAISLAYTLPTAADRHDLSIPELLQIGSMAGHKILRSLDRQLKPQQLKDCSEDKLRCLFLLVIGTILAIGYTNPSTCGTDAQNGSQFEGRQSFLCQLLAHYVVYLGSQLKHQIASHADQFILQAAPARWHKQGIFQWLSGPDETSELPLGLDLEQDTIFEGSNNFSHGLGDFRPSDSFKAILDHCYAAGDFWQDSVSLGGWPSQSFADAAFFHPVQAQGLNETEESFLAKPIDFILDPNFTSSCHCAPKQKRMIKLYRRPISIFDQVSPCQTTEPSPHLTQTAEGFLSCQADEGTLHNLGNDNSTAYQQFGETPVDGYSLHHDSKQDTEVTPPHFSLSHVPLKERISMESVPNQSKLDPEQQLEVTRIRQRSACMTCSTPRQSRDLGGSRCRSCSRGLLAYEQQFLDFVPNQSLIPEWNVSSSDVPQSQSSACRGFFPIDGPANHETRRLLV